MITSPYILYVNGTLYDLTKVCSWYEESPNTDNTILARFWDTDATFVRFNKPTFEAAMQAAQTAGY